MSTAYALYIASEDYARDKDEIMRQKQSTENEGKKMDAFVKAWMKATQSPSGETYHDRYTNMLETNKKLARAAAQERRTEKYRDAPIDRLVDQAMVFHPGGGRYESQEKITAIMPPGKSPPPPPQLLNSTRWRRGKASAAAASTASPQAAAAAASREKSPADYSGVIVHISPLDDDAVRRPLGHTCTREIPEKCVMSQLTGTIAFASLMDSQNLGIATLKTWTVEQRKVVLEDDADNPSIHSPFWDTKTTLVFYNTENRIITCELMIVWDEDGDIFYRNSPCSIADALPVSKHLLIWDVKGNEGLGQWELHEKNAQESRLVVASTPSESKSPRECEFPGFTCRYAFDVMPFEVRTDPASEQPFCGEYNAQVEDVADDVYYHTDYATKRQYKCFKRAQYWIIAEFNDIGVFHEICKSVNKRKQGEDGSYIDDDPPHHPRLVENWTPHHSIPHAQITTLVRYPLKQTPPFTMSRSTPGYGRRVTVVKKDEGSTSSQRLRFEYTHGKAQYAGTKKFEGGKVSYSHWPSDRLPETVVFTTEKPANWPEIPYVDTLHLIESDQEVVVYDLRGGDILSRNSWDESTEQFMGPFLTSRNDTQINFRRVMSYTETYQWCFRSQIKETMQATTHSLYTMHRHLPVVGRGFFLAPRDSEEPSHYCTHARNVDAFFFEGNTFEPEHQGKVGEVWVAEHRRIKFTARKVLESVPTRSYRWQILVQNIPTHKSTPFQQTDAAFIHPIYAEFHLVQVLVPVPEASALVLALCEDAADMAKLDRTIQKTLANGLDAQPLQTERAGQQREFQAHKNTLTATFAGVVQDHLQVISNTFLGFVNTYAIPLSEHTRELQVRAIKRLETTQNVLRENFQYVSSAPQQHALQRARSTHIVAEIAEIAAEEAADVLRTQRNSHIQALDEANRQSREATPANFTVATTQVTENRSNVLELENRLRTATEHAEQRARETDIAIRHLHEVTHTATRDLARERARERLLFLEELNHLETIVNAKMNRFDAFAGEQRRRLDEAAGEQRHRLDNAAEKQFGRLHAVVDEVEDAYENIAQMKENIAHMQQDILDREAAAAAAAENWDERKRNVEAMEGSTQSAAVTPAAYAAAQQKAAEAAALLDSAAQALRDLIARHQDAMDALATKQEAHEHEMGEVAASVLKTADKFERDIQRHTQNAATSARNASQSDAKSSKYAERAGREADRAGQEADRARDEADHAAEEVEEQVDRARNEADRARDEADTTAYHRGLAENDSWGAGKYLSEAAVHAEEASQARGNAGLSAAGAAQARDEVVELASGMAGAWQSVADRLDAGLESVKQKELEAMQSAEDAESAANATDIYKKRAAKAAGAAADSADGAYQEEDLAGRAAAAADRYAQAAFRDNAAVRGQYGAAVLTRRRADRAADEAEGHANRIGAAAALELSKINDLKRKSNAVDAHLLLAESETNRITKMREEIEKVAAELSTANAARVQNVKDMAAERQSLADARKEHEKNKADEESGQKRVQDLIDQYELRLAEQPSPAASGARTSMARDPQANAALDAARVRLTEATRLNTESEARITSGIQQLATLQARDVAVTGVQTQTAASLQALTQQYHTFEQQSAQRFQVHEAAVSQQITTLRQSIPSNMAVDDPGQQVRADVTALRQEMQAAVTRLENGLADQLRIVTQEGTTRIDGIDTQVQTLRGEVASLQRQVASTKTSLDADIMHVKLEMHALEQKLMDEIQKTVQDTTTVDTLGRLDTQMQDANARLNVLEALADQLRGADALADAVADADDSDAGAPRAVGAPPLGNSEEIKNLRQRIGSNMTELTEISRQLSGPPTFDDKELLNFRQSTHRLRSAIESDILSLQQLGESHVARHNLRVSMDTLVHAIHELNTSAQNAIMRRQTADAFANQRKALAEFTQSLVTDQVQALSDVLQDQLMRRMTQFRNARKTMSPQEMSKAIEGIMDHQDGDEKLHSSLIEAFATFVDNNDSNYTGPRLPKYLFAKTMAAVKAHINTRGAKRKASLAVLLGLLLGISQYNDTQSVVLQPFESFNSGTAARLPPPGNGALPDAGTRSNVSKRNAEEASDASTFPHTNSSWLRSGVNWIRSFARRNLSSVPNDDEGADEDIDAEVTEEAEEPTTVAGPRRSSRFVTAESGPISWDNTHARRTYLRYVDMVDKATALWKAEESKPRGERNTRTRNRLLENVTTLTNTMREHASQAGVSEENQLADLAERAAVRAAIPVQNNLAERAAVRAAIPVQNNSQGFSLQDAGEIPFSSPPSEEDVPRRPRLQPHPTETRPGSSSDVFPNLPTVPMTFSTTPQAQTPPLPLAGVRPVPPAAGGSPMLQNPRRQSARTSRTVSRYAGRGGMEPSERPRYDPY